LIIAGSAGQTEILSSNRGRKQPALLFRVSAYLAPPPRGRKAFAVESKNIIGLEHWRCPRIITRIRGSEICRRARRREVNLPNSKIVGAIISLVFRKFEKGRQVDACARAFARIARIGMPFVGGFENLSRSTGRSEAQQENFQGFNAVGLSSRDGIAQFEAPRETDNIAGSGVTIQWHCFKFRTFRQHFFSTSTG